MLLVENNRPYSTILKGWYSYMFQSEIVSDMRSLRTRAEDMDLFKPRMGFYAAHLGHILALEVLGWMVLWHYGTGWLPYLLTAAILTTAQVCFELTEKARSSSLCSHFCFSILQINDYQNEAVRESSLVPFFVYQHQHLPL